MADKKDEIISMQLDLIRTMTENNLRRIGNDFWGTPATKKEKPAEAAPQKDAAPKAAQESAPKPQSEEEAIPEKENIDDLRAELDGYIGLERIKAEIDNYRKFKDLCERLVALSIEESKRKTEQRIKEARGKK